MRTHSFSPFTWQGIFSARLNKRLECGLATFDNFLVDFATLSRIREAKVNLEEELELVVGEAYLIPLGPEIKNIWLDECKFQLFNSTLIDHNRLHMVSRQFGFKRGSSRGKVVLLKVGHDSTEFEPFLLHSTLHGKWERRRELSVWRQSLICVQ